MHRIQIFFVFCLLLSTPLRADEPVDYEKQIKPILKSRCYACHGALKQEAELRLDTAVLVRKGGESGPAVVAHKTDESPLIERASVTIDDGRMPPEGRPLTAEQIALLAAWVSQGAHSPENELPEPDLKDHWAFRPPVRPNVPRVGNPGWVRNPIDAFILAEQEQHELGPLSEADPHVLLRRVHLDLIGLPPTRSELHRFVKDGSPQSYESLVDDLLDRPQYGERWGRHWMDVWRYSDWYGRRNVNDVRNSYPHIWRWRDWIIKSLNADKGYDRMIVEMLAADEIAPTDDGSIVATGFIVRNWFSLNYDQWMRDVVEHTGKAFLGLRLNCALCHDHKYDPISQEDYFRFRAFFEPIEMRHDRVPGGTALARYVRYRPGSGAALRPIAAGIARIYDQSLDAETRIYKLGDQRDVIEDKPPVAPGVPSFLGGRNPEIKSIDLPPQAWYPGLKDFAQQAEMKQRSDALRQVEQAAIAAASNISKVEAELKKAQAAHAKAKQFLDSIAAEPAAKNKARTRVSRSLQDIGYWRFEGADGPGGFLADSSGRGHTLQRINGTDPPARPAALAAGSPGYAFPNPIPSSGASNNQAANFQQRKSFAYLAAAGHLDFHADRFTLEACVHFKTSARNFNRTIADYSGSWTLLHRGLDQAQFELRLICIDAGGNVRDVSTSKADPPLVLSAKADYFVAVTVDDSKITFYAKRLDRDSVLQTAGFPRDDGKTAFGSLARPGEQTQFKIGNSDGTGRVDGLIDEVRYARGAMPQAEIEAALFESPAQQARSRLAGADRDVRLHQSALEVAQLDEKLAEAALEHARLELKAIEARVNADNVRFKATKGNGDDAARAANRAERQAVHAAARRKVAEAEKAVFEEQAKLPPGSKTNPAVAKAEKQRVSAEAAAKAALAQIEKDSTTYTPIGPKYRETSTGRRTALARWIASDKNPLTARVAVNHIWMRHFGRPLVDSVYDFGRAGKQPTHPQLIDWLAVELMESGWRMKHIHRLIVTSNTYRMRSNVRTLDHPNLAVDRDNRYWWRFERKRMEAELLRDSLLHVSGHLDMTLGGQEIDNKLGPSVPRRSLYFSRFPEGGGTMPFLELFDAPDPGECYRRSDSVVPQQALALANSHITLNYGRRLAQTLWAGVEKEVPAAADREEAYIQAAFQRILARKPTDEEQVRCAEFLRKQRTLFESRDAATLAGTPANGIQAASAAAAPRARESLIRVLFSHNDFITIH